MADESKLEYISIGEFHLYGTKMFWYGCIAGTVGTAAIGFISLWTLGAFLP